MSAFEAIQAGNSRQAMEAIARRCGLSFWTAYRIASGTTKTLGAGVSDKIKAEYLRFCERQMKALEHEIFLLRQGENANDFEDLGAAIDRLRSQLDAQKARLNLPSRS